MVLLARLDNVSCPVRWLQKYLDLCNIAKNDYRFIFRGVQFSKEGLRLVSINKHVSYSNILKYFKEFVGNIGLNVNKYGLHSLRSGGTSAAVLRGADLRMVQRHGRWKSVKSMNMYVKDSTQSKLGVTRCLVD